MVVAVPGEGSADAGCPSTHPLGAHDASDEPWRNAATFPAWSRERIAAVPDVRKRARHGRVSSRTRTSRCRSATAGRPARARGSPPGLVTLPAALESPCGLALPVRYRRTDGLDRIRGRTEVVRGDVRDGPGLARCVRGIPCRPTQRPCRAHGTAARRASLHHRDLPTDPGAGTFDGLTWSPVIRLCRLEEVEDVLRARRRPQGEEMVIRIGEGPTTPNRHQPRVPNRGEDRWFRRAPSTCVRPPRQGARGQATFSNRGVLEDEGGSSMPRGPNPPRAPLNAVLAVRRQEPERRVCGGHQPVARLRAIPW